MRAVWGESLSSRNNVFFGLGAQLNVLSEEKNLLIRKKLWGFFYSFIFAERFLTDFILSPCTAIGNCMFCYTLGHKFFVIIAHLFG